MGDTITSVYWLSCQVLVFATFIGICGLLLQRRFQLQKSLWILGGFLLGVVVINGALLLTGHPILQVLGLLLLTAYFPMIVCLHILSKSNFFQTAAIWSISLVGYFILQFSVKFMQRLATLYGAWPFDMILVIAGILLIGACILWIVYRYAQELFQEYVLERSTNWLSLWLPLLLLLSLFSYFSNSVTDPIVFLLLFLMSISIFFLQFKILVFTDEALRLRKAENAYGLQMELQKHDYETICKKLEMGRAYRHDMRHHLTALNGSLQQGNTEEALAYIQSLGDQFNQTEWKVFCENPMVNAVISFYTELAKEMGCSITTNVLLPKETVYGDMDLCALFSNALENAIHACEKIADEGKRKIEVTALWEEKKVVISIENTCEQPLVFDEEGFPVVPKQEGHGIGLRSMAAISKKYNGVFLCSLQDGIFATKIAIFNLEGEGSAKRTSLKQPGKKALTTACIVAFLLISSSPALVNAWSDVPLIGPLLQIITLENYSFRWGDNRFEAELPGAKGSSAAQATSQQLEAYVAQLRKEFATYVSLRHQGYVGMDTTYVVLSKGEDLLSVAFETTLNAGSSETIKRIFTLDKRTGQIIGLQELFRKDADYIGVISQEILVQMQSQVQAGEADYFIPGGIWSDEECFKAIAPDQNFYINQDNRLVIVFDEYMVAPGSMGSPEFVIPDEVTATLK